MVMMLGGCSSILLVIEKEVGGHMRKYYLLLGGLNIFDGLATHIGLSLNVIEELNPIMNGLYEIHPSIFIITKLLLSVGLYSVSLWSKTSQFSLLKWLTFAAIGLYSGICLMHLIWISSLVWN